MVPKIVFNIIFLGFLLSACTATNTSVMVKEEIDPPLDLILIMAVTNKYETREMWEKELGYRLRTKGFNTITSVGIDESHKKLYTLDEIKALVEKLDIDGVITMKLQDIKQKEGYSGSDRYISEGAVNRSGFNSGYMYNYLTPYMNVYQWTYQMEETIIIEGNLFEAKTAKMIFQTETQMTNAESDEALAGEITESLSIALRQSKLMLREEK